MQLRKVLDLAPSDTKVQARRPIVAADKKRGETGEIALIGNPGVATIEELDREIAALESERDARVLDTARITAEKEAESAHQKALATARAEHQRKMADARL